MAHNNNNNNNTNINNRRVKKKMAQEEYIVGRCHSGGGGSGGGGCRPKKTKQKKAPQRGLGVAQLEKIISEEKQKKGGYFGKNVHSDNTHTHTQTHPPPPPRASPFLAIHPNNFRPNTTDVVLQENNWPYKSWSANEYNHHNLLHQSPTVIAYDPQLNVAYDHSNAQILAHQFQRPPPSSSLVKSTPGIQTVMMISTQNQMEPPSIPSFHSKNYAEDKMMGMMKKRPYPFSQIISSSKPDELASFTTDDQQQYTHHHMEPRYRLIRESVPNPGPPERNLNEAPTDSERLHGNFLTLAPPAATSPPLTPVHKHTLDYLGHPRHELSENHYLPTQEYGHKRQLIDRAGPSGSVEKSFSFFPVELRTNQNTGYASSGDGKRGETIDLNLKL